MKRQGQKSESNRSKFIKHSVNKSASVSGAGAHRLPGTKMTDTVKKGGSIAGLHQQYPSKTKNGYQTPMELVS